MGPLVCGQCPGAAARPRAVRRPAWCTAPVETPPLEHLGERWRPRLRDCMPVTGHCGAMAHHIQRLITVTSRADACRLHNTESFALTRACLGPAVKNSALGAGDRNRTRTISLGIRPIGAPDRPDLGIRHTASDCHGPCDTGDNGPPMARRLIDPGTGQNPSTRPAAASAWRTACAAVHHSPLIEDPGSKDNDAVEVLLLVRGRSGSWTRAGEIGGCKAQSDLRR